MNQEVLTLTPGALPLAQSLGFEARSVTVDNYTSSYVTLSDVGKTIPPWVYGAVVVLPPGLRRASAVLTPTVPAIPGPPVPVSQATLTWTDQLLPAMPGHLLQQSTITTPQEVLTLTLPGGAATGSITLPVGTQSLAIVTVVGAGDTSSLNLTGATSGFGYYGQQLGTSAYEIIGVDVAADTVLTYSASRGSGAGVSWFLTALLTPPPTFIQRLPAPWQVPTTITPLNQIIGHGTSFDWVTPPAGRNLRVFTSFLHWQTSTAGFGTIKGSASTGDMQKYDQKATNWLQFDYGGGGLAPGEKLQISNDDTANGLTIKGYVATTLD